MKNSLLLLILIFLLAGLRGAAQKPETANVNKGSGIDTIILGDKTVERLALLGEVWGFLKYHHPTIAKEKIDWDASLFALLPKVLSVGNDTEFSAVLENWTAQLGSMPPCQKCSVLPQYVEMLPDYANMFTNDFFSKELVSRLSFIRDNASNSKHHYVSFKTANNPSFDHEKDYPARYPDAGVRLLALFRYWNMVQYFSPNRQLATTPWPMVLRDFIPQLIKASNRDEYALCVARLICTIGDTHANLGSEVLYQLAGKNIVPFEARFIEGALVVTKFYKDTLNVTQHFNLGDVITKLNGRPVAELVQQYLPLTSASNYETALRDMPLYYLLRSNASEMEIECKRSNSLTTISQGLIPYHVRYHVARFTAYNGEQGFKVLENGIGYISGRAFKKDNYDELINAFKKVKGIVVDLRGYPENLLIPTVVNDLKEKPTPFVKIVRGSISRPGCYTASLTTTGGRGRLGKDKKVVVIVNEFTQSHAEYVAMAFAQVPNARIIGSSTAGADGNISLITLPGRFNTNISGLGIKYPDGTNAQGQGVKIDKVVKPTIEGIKAGRDELLEKAEEMILQ